MKRLNLLYAMGLLGAAFVAGVLVGRSPEPRKPPTKPVDFGADVAIYEGQQGPARVLRPYNVITDGRSKTVAAPSPVAVKWIVAFDDHRVQVACTEVTEGR